jgi:hypothetical protein
VTLLLLSILAAADGGGGNFLNCQARQSTLDDGGVSWLVTVLQSPLPNDAARASKQPEFGRAGFPVDDVLTIQGKPFMHPIRIDGTGYVQQVTGVVVLADAGTLNINPPASLPLPTGAATSALQDTSNASLSSIDGKLPALVSNRVPVDPSGVTQPVSGTFWPATQPVSGTVTANAGTGTMAVSGPVTDTQLRATPVPISGTVTANAGSGTMAVSLAVAPTTPVTGTFYQATQPVSIASMPSTPVTGAFFQTTQPISAATLPLPSGAATDATLSVLLDGGVQIRGQTLDGTIRPLLLTEGGAQWVKMLPGAAPNALLLPCNAVRRSNCR